MPLCSKQDLSLDENHRQKEGSQPQSMDEDGEGL
jgi:hypothetical protein